MIAIFVAIPLVALVTLMFIILLLLRFDKTGRVEKRLVPLLKMLGFIVVLLGVLSFLLYQN